MKIRSFLIALTALAIAAGAGYGAYQGKVYHAQGGKKMVVASGGEVEVQSGGTLEIQSGATFTNANVLSAAGILNTGKYYGLTAATAWSDTTGWSGPKAFIFAAGDTIYIYTAAHTISKFPAI